jgi:hypothetical protein
VYALKTASILEKRADRGRTSTIDQQKLPDSSLSLLNLAAYGNINRVHLERKDLLYLLHKVNAAHIVQKALNGSYY